MTSSEDEQWARLVIFLLVGLYIIVIMSLMIRFLIKTCRISPNSEWQLSAWQHFLHETEIRRLQAPDTPPPSFPAALKCPVPRTHSIVSMCDQTPPPSYEEVYSKSTSSSLPAASLPPLMTPAQQNQRPNNWQDGSNEYDFKGITVLHL